jgi:serine/threonine protein kinase
MEVIELQKPNRVFIVAKKFLRIFPTEASVPATVPTVAPLAVLPVMPPVALAAKTVSGPTTSPSSSSASSAPRNAATLRVLPSIPEPEIAHSVIRFSELTLTRRLGAGSYGEVFEGRWRGSVVAIKRLFIGADGCSDEFRTEFTKEVMVLMQLRHPRIVLLLGHTSPYDPDGVGLIFELAEGGSLYSALHTLRLMVHERQIAIDLGEALHYLHTRTPQILHRDLKSLNVLLDAGRRHATLCDFGASRIKETSHASVHTMVGTGAWMAPEILSDEAHGAPADVYSYAMVLYELAAKSVPFGGKSALILARLVVDQRKRPEIPAGASWRLCLILLIGLSFTANVYRCTTPLDKAH